MLSWARSGTVRMLDRTGLAPTCLRVRMNKCLWPVVFSLLVVSLPIKSQQPLVGLIQGMIVDQKHAPIAHAELTATNIDSVVPESNRRTTTADEQGLFQLIDVPEGRYFNNSQKARLSGL